MLKVSSQQHWSSACEAKVNVNAAEMPGREVLETALTWTPTPRPIPNLGYACLNMDLREQKPPIFTNRSPPPLSPPLPSARSTLKQACALFWCTDG